MLPREGGLARYLWSHHQGGAFVQLQIIHKLEVCVLLAVPLSPGKTKNPFDDSVHVCVCLCVCVWGGGTGAKPNIMIHDPRGSVYEKGFGDSIHGHSILGQINIVCACVCVCVVIFFIIAHWRIAARSKVLFSENRAHQNGGINSKISWGNALCPSRTGLPKYLEWHIKYVHFLYPIPKISTYSLHKWYTITLNTVPGWWYECRQRVHT